MTPQVSYHQAVQVGPAPHRARAIARALPAQVAAVAHARRVGRATAAPRTTAATLLVVLAGILVVAVEFVSGTLRPEALMGLAVAGLATIAASADVRSAMPQWRAEVASAAAVDERARIARDLHDLLGHTLSVATVKTELARRLLERDPNRAAAELQDVENAVRMSLDDVRQAVAGYRAVSLESQLMGARAALAAADIELHAPGIPPALDATTDALLGWVVREGVTNVVRHSNARNAWVDVRETGGMVRLQLVDDGRSAAQGSARAPGGNGLRGLRERVEAAGGTLEADFTSGGGFRVAVKIAAER